MLASTAPSSKPEWRAASRSAARSVASAVKANWRPNCAASWRVRSEPARASSCRRRSATRCCLCSCAPHALQCLPRQRLRKSRRARQPAPSHQHTSCCVVLKPLKHPHPPPQTARRLRCALTFRRAPSVRERASAVHAESTKLSRYLRRAVEVAAALLLPPRPTGPRLPPPPPLLAPSATCTTTRRQTSRPVPVPAPPFATTPCCSSESASSSTRPLQMMSCFCRAMPFTSLCHSGSCFNTDTVVLPPSGADSVDCCPSSVLTVTRSIHRARPPGRGRGRGPVACGRGRGPVGLGPAAWLQTSQGCWSSIVSY